MDSFTDWSKVILPNIQPDPMLDRVTDNPGNRTIIFFTNCQFLAS